jgi:hypothetical protein
MKSLHKHMMRNNVCNTPEYTCRYHELQLAPVASAEAYGTLATAVLMLNTNLHASVCTYALWQYVSCIMHANWRVLSFNFSFCTRRFSSMLIIVWQNSQEKRISKGEFFKRLVGLCDGHDFPAPIVKVIDWSQYMYSCRMHLILLSCFSLRFGDGMVNCCYPNPFMREIIIFNAFSNAHSCIEFHECWSNQKW